MEMDPNPCKLSERTTSHYVLFIREVYFIIFILLDFALYMQVNFFISFTSSWSWHCYFSSHVKQINFTDHRNQFHLISLHFWTVYIVSFYSTIFFIVSCYSTWHWPLNYLKIIIKLTLRVISFETYTWNGNK